MTTEMAIEDSEDVLREILARQVAEFQEPTNPAEAIIATMDEFADVFVVDAGPADEEGDVFLAQFGTSHEESGEHFVVEMTRQMTEGDDDDAPLWQVSLRMLWPVSAETAALGEGEEWSFGVENDEFFEAARELPGWAWALEQEKAPSDVVIELSEV